jgi:RNA polymerase sigma-70 factor (ECF subfamily)
VSGKDDPGSKEPSGPRDVEGKLETLVRKGDLTAAATLAYGAYGPEVLGYLVNVLGSRDSADEVFSQSLEDLWRGLAAFGFRCTVRTWFYVLARHAVARFQRAPWNQRGRRAGDEQMEGVIAQTRTSTQPWLRTDVKDRWRALRDSLEPDDRSLLVLRVDRGLEWKDIARVTLGEECPEATQLTREADRLKKRFQSLKNDLRQRARDIGLVEGNR